MTTNLRSGFTAAAVALMTLASANAAHAAMSTPVQIDAGGSGWTPAAAVNGGTAVVSLEAQGDGLKVITSAGAGHWNPAVSLTAPTARAKGAAVTADEDGNQTAIWGEYLMISAGMGMPNPGPTSIRAAHRTATGAWSAPEQLSPAGVDANGQISAVVAPDGRVTATWLEGADVYFSTRPLGGAWSPRAKVTGAESTEALALAVAKDGTVTAVWRDATSDFAMASTLTDSAWTTPIDISGATVSGLTLDMHASGDATAVWEDTNGVFASRRPTTGDAWSAPQKLSGNNGAYGYYPPGIAIGEAGQATVVWNEYSSGGNRMFAAERAADGTWGASFNLGPGDSSRPAVGTAPTGEVYAGWYGVQTRFVSRAADGTWATPTVIPAFQNAQPLIVSDPDGDVLMVGAPNGAPVQVAGFDHAGPGLTALSVPASAQVGEAVTLSVSPIDLWSALGTVTWSFGDGETATGSAATHTFTGVGTKKVSVTATDAFGRARTRTRAVTVTPKIVGDPPPTTPEPPTTGTTTDQVAPPASTPSACTPRATTTVKWKLPKGTKVRRATITVSGQKKARVLKRKARSAKLDLRTAKGNVVTVTIRTRTTKGKLVTRTQRYTLCA